MKRIIIFLTCILPSLCAIWLGGYILGRDTERVRHIAPSSAAVKAEAPKPDDACAPDSVVYPMDIAKQPGFVVKQGNGEILIGLNNMCVPKDGALMILHMKDICPGPPPNKPHSPEGKRGRAKVTPLGIGGPTTGMDTYIAPVDGRSPKKKAVNPHMMHGKGVFIAPKIITSGSVSTGSISMSTPYTRYSYSFIPPDEPLPPDHPRLICDYTGSQEYECHWEEKKTEKPSPWNYFYLPVIPDGYYLICADNHNCMLEKISK